MESLRHGLNIRTQNVPIKTPNKLQRSLYSERTDTPQSRHPPLQNQVPSAAHSSRTPERNILNDNTSKEN